MTTRLRTIPLMEQEEARHTRRRGTPAVRRKDRPACTLGPPVVGRTFTPFEPHDNFLNSLMMNPEPPDEPLLNDELENGATSKFKLPLLRLAKQ